MSCINDEQYKLKLDKEFPKAGFLQDIFLSIVGPIYCMYLVGMMYFRSSDKNAARLNELKGEDTFKNRIYASDTRIPFDKIKK